MKDERKERLDKRETRRKEEGFVLVGDIVDLECANILCMKRALML